MTKKKDKGSKTATNKNKNIAATESSSDEQKKELTLNTTSNHHIDDGDDDHGPVVERSPPPQEAETKEVVEEHLTPDTSSQQQQQQQLQQQQSSNLEEEQLEQKKTTAEEEQEQQNENHNEHDVQQEQQQQVEAATSSSSTTTTAASNVSENESFLADDNTTSSSNKTDTNDQQQESGESVVHDDTTTTTTVSVDTTPTINNNNNNQSPLVITDMIQSFMTQMSSQMEDNLLSRVNSLSSQLESVQGKYNLLKEKQKQQEESQSTMSSSSSSSTNDIVQTATTTTNAQDQSISADVNIEALKISYEKQLTEKTEELESLKKKMVDWKEKVKIITKKDAQKIESFKKQISQKDEMIKSLQEQVATHSETHPPVVSSEDGTAVATADSVSSNASEFASIESQNKEFAQKIASLESDLTEKNDMITNLNTIIESFKENERLRMQEEQTEKQQEQTVEEKQESDPSKIVTLYSVRLDDSENCVEWYYVRDENFSDESQQYYWTLTVPNNINNENSAESEAKNEQQDHLLPSLSLSVKQYRELQAKSTELTANLSQQIAQVDSLNEELKRYKQRAQKALKKKMDEVSTLKIENEQRIKALSGERDVLADSLREQQQINSELKEQLTQFIALQEELIRSNETCDKLTAENTQLSMQVSQLTSQVSELKTSHIQQLENERNAHECKVLELSDNIKQVETQYRKELQMSRERTRRLLDEKEREIAKLQLKMQDLAKKQQQLKEMEIQQQQVVSEQPQETVSEQPELPANEEQQQQVAPMETQNSTQNSTTNPPPSEKPDIISSVLSDITNGHLSASSTDIPATSTSTPASNSPTPDVTPSTPSQSSAGGSASDFEKMLALAQIQATRDVELSEYKRTIHALQQQLGERERREEHLRKMEKQMKDQIDHFERLYGSGTGPNLEYLKNVLCKFLETANDDKNDQMRRKLFNVIATILDLSNEEQEKIMQQWKNSKEGKDSTNATPLSRWSLFGGK